jgi:hypothetical protein
MTFDAPWEAVDEGLGDRLLSELRSEVDDADLLAAGRLRVVARRMDRDDVLVALPEDRWAVVHLTWRGSTEPDPRYPSTTMFGSTAELEARLHQDRVEVFDE